MHQGSSTPDKQIAEPFTFQQQECHIDGAQKEGDNQPGQNHGDRREAEPPGQQDDQTDGEQAAGHGGQVGAEGEQARGE